MQDTITHLADYLQQLSVSERRQVERLCQVKTANVVKRLNDDWSLLDLEKLQSGFKQWAEK